MAWGTTADLLSAVRLRAMRPDAAADGAVSDADILSLADEELALRLVPIVRSVREDHWVTHVDYTIVDGQGDYRIPGRAQASGLRDVTVRSDDGNEWSIPRLNLEDRGPAERGADIYGAQRGFVVEGNSIVLLPISGSYSGSTLRVRYHRRHPILVPTTEANQVDVGGGAGAWTCTPQGGATWVTALDGATEVDVWRHEPQFGPWGVDAAVTGSISGGTTDTETIAVAEAPTSSPSGAWVSLPDTSPVIQLPYECWPLLVSCVVSRVLEIVGDREGMAAAHAKYEREVVNVLNLLEPRVEGAQQRIINRNSHLRSRGWWRW